MKDVDLKLLGPGGLVELWREGKAALGDVVVPILPPMTFSVMLDAGAHVLVKTVVEVVGRSRLRVVDKPTEMAGQQLRFGRPATGEFA